MVRQTAAFLLVSCFLVVADYSAEAIYTTDQMKQIGAACNATQSDLDVVMKYVVPSTSSGKCLVTCMLQKSEALTEEGLYDKNKALEAITKHWSEVDSKKREDLVEECNEIVKGQEALAKSDPCEYGYKVGVCINKLISMLPAVPSA